MGKYQINEENLDKVTGGNGSGYASDTYLPEDHGKHISAADAVNYKQKEVYFISDINESIYGYGTLIDSKLDYNYSGFKDYMHTIYVKGRSDVQKAHSIPLKQNFIIPAEIYTLYEKTSK